MTIFPDTSLKELRKGARLTQAQVAARMGTAQNQISKLEARSEEGDLLLSTLRAYVKAVGGELVLTVEMPPPQEDWADACEETATAKQEKKIDSCAVAGTLTELAVQHLPC